MGGETGKKDFSWLEGVLGAVKNGKKNINEVRPFLQQVLNHPNLPKNLRRQVQIVLSGSTTRRERLISEIPELEAPKYVKGNTPYYNPPEAPEAVVVTTASTPEDIDIKESIKQTKKVLKNQGVNFNKTIIHAKEVLNINDTTANITEEFIEKVKEFQDDNWLKADGIYWRNTSKVLHLNNGSITNILEKEYIETSNEGAFLTELYIQGWANWVKDTLGKLAALAWSTPKKSIWYDIFTIVEKAVLDWDDREEYLRIKKSVSTAVNNAVNIVWTDEKPTNTLIEELADWTDVWNINILIIAERISGDNFYFSEGFKVSWKDIDSQNIANKITEKLSEKQRLELAINKVVAEYFEENKEEKWKNEKKKSIVELICNKKKIDFRNLSLDTIKNSADLSFCEKLVLNRYLKNNLSLEERVERLEQFHAYQENPEAIYNSALDKLAEQDPAQASTVRGVIKNFHKNIKNMSNAEKVQYGSALLWSNPISFVILSIWLFKLAFWNHESQTWNAIGWAAVASAFWATGGADKVKKIFQLIWMEIPSLSGKGEGNEWSWDWDWDESTPESISEKQKELFKELNLPKERENIHYVDPDSYASLHSLLVESTSPEAKKQFWGLDWQGKFDILFKEIAKNNQLRGKKISELFKDDNGLKNSIYTLLWFSWSEETHIIGSIQYSKNDIDIFMKQLLSLKNQAPAGDATIGWILKGKDWKEEAKDLAEDTFEDAKKAYDYIKWKFDAKILPFIKEHPLASSVISIWVSFIPWVRGWKIIKWVLRWGGAYILWDEAFNKKWLDRAWKWISENFKKIEKQVIDWEKTIKELELSENNVTKLNNILEDDTLSFNKKLKKLSELVTKDEDKLKIQKAFYKMNVWLLTWFITDAMDAVDWSVDEDELNKKIKDLEELLEVDSKISWWKGKKAIKEQITKYKKKLKELAEEDKEDSDDTDESWAEIQTYAGIEAIQKNIKETEKKSSEEISKLGGEIQQLKAEKRWLEDWLANKAVGTPLEKDEKRIAEIDIEIWKKRVELEKKEKEAKEKLQELADKLITKLTEANSTWLIDRTAYLDSLVENLNGVNKDALPAKVIAINYPRIQAELIMMESMHSMIQKVNTNIRGIKEKVSTVVDNYKTKLYTKETTNRGVNIEKWKWVSIIAKRLQNKDFLAFDIKVNGSAQTFKEQIETAYIKDAKKKLGEKKLEMEWLRYKNSDIAISLPPTPFQKNSSINFLTPKQKENRKKELKKQAKIIIENLETLWLWENLKGKEPFVYFWKEEEEEEAPETASAPAATPAPERRIPQNWIATINPSTSATPAAPVVATTLVTERRVPEFNGTFLEKIESDNILDTTELIEIKWMGNIRKKIIVKMITSDASLSDRWVIQKTTIFDNYLSNTVSEIRDLAEESDDELIKALDKALKK